MKRFLSFLMTLAAALFAAASALLIPTLAHAAQAPVTLSECYELRETRLGSVRERAVEAAKYGIWQYKGTAAQNTALKDALCPPDQGSNGDLGFSVVTDFQKVLAAPMTQTQTFIPLSSFSLRDGSTLSIADLGNLVFLTIEPGAAKEELVYCTAQNVSSNYFTNCTRGLAFSGSSTSTVLANQKTHAAGSTVVISNVHYVYEQYLDLTGRAQTVNGIKTFTSYPRFYATTTLPTLGAEFATKQYVDTVGAGGFTAVNVSTTRGLSVDGSAPEKVGINASTTRAIAFDSVTGALMLNASTTQGLKFGTSTGDLQFDQSANLIFTGNVTSSGSLRVQSPTNTNDAVPKGFVDQSVYALSATGTAEAAITAGQAVYVSSTGLLSPTATASPSSTFRYVGIALTSVPAGQVFSYTRPSGINCNQSGMTPSAEYFLNGSSGQISLLPATNYVKIGRAITATCIQLIDPKMKLSGTASITSAGTTVINTAFYPTRITFQARDNNTSSFGTEENVCTYSLEFSGAPYFSTSIDNSAAFCMRTTADSQSRTGAVTNRGAYGFTLTTTDGSSPQTVTLYYTAQN